MGCVEALLASAVLCVLLHALLQILTHSKFVTTVVTVHFFLLYFMQDDTAASPSEGDLEDVGHGEAILV